MLKKLSSFSILLLLPLIVGAQQNLGISTSNWSGIESLSQNPANIADSREKICIEIVSLNAGVENNLGSLNTKGGLISALNNGNATNLFNYSNNNSFSLLAPYAQVKLPGLMINLDHKNSIAITTSINGISQFNNFNQSLFQTITNASYTANSDINLTSNKFNYTAQLWSQVALTYGGVILDCGSSELKIGVTLKYLRGIGYIGLKGNNLDANYKANNDSLHVTNSDLEFASNILNTQNAIFTGANSSTLLSELFGNKSGLGAGGDVGIIYDFIPACNRVDEGQQKDYSKNRYKLRLSASIMDIGNITYDATRNFNAEVTGNGYITAAGLSQNVTNFSDFKNYAVKQGFTADTGALTTKLYMPTTLHLAADYNIVGRFYVNATYIANLANRQDFGNSYYNQFSVTPRYDTRLFSVGVPITYSMLTNNLQVGVGVRVEGFFIGSDDMLALFANHQYGFDVYAGGYVPINYKYHKTRDIGTLNDDVKPEPDMDHGGSADTAADCPDLFLPSLSSEKNSNPALPANNKTEVDSKMLIVVDDADNKGLR